MFTHLLVPLDGSSLAESVLPTTAALADKRHSEVTLLHVIERGAPARPRASIVSHMPGRPRGSSPVVGSSRNRTGGRATSAAARSSRRRMPPE